MHSIIHCFQGESSNQVSRGGGCLILTVLGTVKILRKLHNQLQFSIWRDSESLGRLNLRQNGAINGRFWQHNDGPQLWLTGKRPTCIALDKFASLKHEFVSAWFDEISSKRCVPVHLRGRFLVRSKSGLGADDISIIIHNIRIIPGNQRVCADGHTQRRLFHNIKLNFFDRFQIKPTIKIGIHEFPKPVGNRELLYAIQPECCILLTVNHTM
mmetsp:Transcript_18282/g.28644  ORF Transcript_18282/g.28644 Transcript_18282/m.28644 type:complete len:212 (-) Transcript_18282:2160-2795(-)